MSGLITYWKTFFKYSFLRNTLSKGLEGHVWTGSAAALLERWTQEENCRFSLLEVQRNLNRQKIFFASLEITIHFLLMKKWCMFSRILHMIISFVASKKAFLHFNNLHCKLTQQKCNSGLRLWWDFYHSFFIHSP